MFNRSFKQFLNKKPSKEELYPYLYSIAFKELGQPKEETKKDPTECTYCGAIFTDVNLIKEDDVHGTHYVCEFCGTINKVDKSLKYEKFTNDICFILSEIRMKDKKEEKITKVDVIEGDLYISVIDISGSMSGAKIEAVKKSLVQTIKDFKINSPTTKFILIAFESSVYYYMRNDKDPINFSGDLLFSLDGMKMELEKSVEKKRFLGSIGEFADGWIQKVQNLRSMDMTALGPALYFAIISFELFSSTGRITLLTDGLANQGIGNLSGTSIKAKEFYEKMADMCNSKNIIVDVVGVSSPGDSNEMGLQTLGMITDKTGGTLYLISSEEMEVIFSELRQTEYIGRDVKVKIIIPPSVNIKNITGAYSSKGTLNESEINIGAITANRELFVQLDSSKELKDKEEIPVQLQVEYIDKDGRKKMRVINDRVKVTKDENEFKSTYDQKFNVAMNIQAAGGQRYRGMVGASKQNLLNLRNEMLSELNHLKKISPFFKENNFTESVDYLNDELEEIEANEMEAAQAPAKSYYATKGQKQARISLQELKKRSEEKKKQ
ncbi:MAG: hypothetical protein ACFFBP_03045 [Promethearchaeota archaeon]